MQDDKLLSGTLADNIAFFDPDLQMARVVEAAKAARVHEDIMRAPMQYLSLVGDMGTTLSAGQRQRVLLARALYRQPKLIVFDEGTANLDEETEELIWDLIAHMPITRIVVAHRSALIHRAGRIFACTNGVCARSSALLRRGDWEGLERSKVDPAHSDARAVARRQRADNACLSLAVPLPQYVGLKPELLLLVR